MKKIWLICCLLIGVTAVNYAQGTYRTTDTTDKAKGLQKQLKLTDEQTAKLQLSIRHLPSNVKG